MDPTEKRILKLAKSAAAMGEKACVTQIGGMDVTIHVPDRKRYETAVGHRRFRALWSHRPGPAAWFSKS